MDLALNNLQRLICHKMQTNQPFSCVQKRAHAPLRVFTKCCCILILDQSINQRFSKLDTPVKISGSSHMVDKKLWLDEMIYSDARVRVSVSWRSV